MGYSDPDETGRRKLLQKSIALGKCTRAEAKVRRDELAVSIRRNEFVAPAKRTLGEWLTTWLDESVRPARRANTVVSYTNIITNHLTPALGGIPLQTLRPGHLTRYYAEKTAAGLSGATLAVHHAVIGSALKSAVRQGLVTRNVAPLVDGRPRAARHREQAKLHCWSAEEARAFLTAAAAAGTQASALFSLALDAGARVGELLALRWSDIDLDAGTVVIDRTLLSRTGSEPVTGPTKTGGVRTIDVNATTVTRLRQHKVHQAEVRMANRPSYQDHNLIFACEWQTRTQGLGAPLRPAAFAGAMDTAIKTAGVRRIKCHGLRHTSATLLLGAGSPVHVVAARLGHADGTTTMSTYAHALPAHGRQAAQTLGALLHG